MCEGPSILPVIIARMKGREGLVPGVSGDLAESLKDSQRRVELVVGHNNCGPVHGRRERS